MRILYIYRSKDAGPSIRRVFEPIGKALNNECLVDSIYLPMATASPVDILRNIQFVKNHLRGKQYDIIHITGLVNYLLWPLRKYRTIVTVHDLGFYTFCTSGLKRIYLYLFFIFPIRYADYVTYISDKSCQEACELIKLPRQRQSVVNNPVDPSFVFTPKTIDKNRPVILHIGTKENKNLPRVLEAVAGIQCKLYIIGSVNEDIQRRISELAIDVEIKNNVSDAEILQAYKECDVVCFPSLYEGFGMPIIEGQAIGRPVVTSDLLPMNRIAGKGAVLVNPYSAEDIRKGLISALDNYDSLVNEGLENVKKFSLSNIVKEYKSIYTSIL